MAWRGTGGELFAIGVLAAACSSSTQSTGSGGSPGAGAGGEHITAGSDAGGASNSGGTAGGVSKSGGTAGASVGGAPSLGGTSGSSAGGVSTSAGAAGSAGATRGLALGSTCVGPNESGASFSGYSVREVNLDPASTECSSKLCLKDHFQGRVSCPYGQAAGAAQCFLPGLDTPVTVEVDPQLHARRSSLASICSCHCEGTGPGPYCTCPDSMECARLVDDLGFGGAPNQLAGSYCIPTGSKYDSTGPAAPCSSPNCGPARPY
ncbi:MAG: hypothetical protein ABIQ16_12200 [Polyangiaceae bacterium]